MTDAVCCDIKVIFPLSIPIIMNIYVIVIQSRLDKNALCNYTWRASCDSYQRSLAKEGKARGKLKGSHATISGLVLIIYNQPQVFTSGQSHSSPLGLSKRHW